MRTYMNARLLAATKLHLESGELAQNQIETNDLMVTDVHIQIVQQMAGDATLTTYTHLFILFIYRLHEGE